MEMYETRLLRGQYCEEVYRAEDSGSWTGIYNGTSMRGAAGMQLTRVSIPHCFATAHSRTTTNVENWFEFTRAYSITSTYDRLEYIIIIDDLWLNVLGCYVSASMRAAPSLHITHAATQSVKPRIVSIATRKTSVHHVQCVSFERCTHALSQTLNTAPRSSTQRENWRPHGTHEIHPDVKASP